MPRSSLTQQPLSRVLLVPPDVVTGELRESFLDRASFLVRSAPDAARALEMAEVWHPSLVIFRAELPGVQISELCRQLRQTCPQDPPKLMMLTETFGDALDDTLEASLDCHLITPVDNTQLLDTIAKLLEVARRRAPRALLETFVHARGFGDAENAQSKDLALGTAISVSEDALLMECDRQLRIGSCGTLQFFLPGIGARLMLPAQVQLAVDEIRLHYAFEFTNVPDKERSLLHDYVSESSAA